MVGEISYQTAICRILKHLLIITTLTVNWTARCPISPITLCRDFQLTCIFINALMCGIYMINCVLDSFGFIFIISEFILYTSGIIKKEIRCLYQLDINPMKRISCCQTRNILYFGIKPLAVECIFYSTALSYILCTMCLLRSKKGYRLLGEL